MPWPQPVDIAEFYRLREPLPLAPLRVRTLPPPPPQERQRVPLAQLSDPPGTPEQRGEMMPPTVPVSPVSPARSYTEVGEWNQMEWDKIQDEMNMEYNMMMDNRRNKRALRHISQEQMERLKRMTRHADNLNNIERGSSRTKKRRVLKRQSTRGKKASRIKQKRQNGSKKRKGVKTRYVQGKKKKKKMNKKSSQKQNKK